MSAVTKQGILDAIRRTAEENGGKPLGTGRFEKETGIKPYDWHKYWARFGDAQKEAGFTANQLTGAYADEYLIEKMISVICKLGKFPSISELFLEKNNDSEFPYRAIKERLASRQEFATKIMEYCKNKNAHGDVIELCASILKTYDKKEEKSGDNNLAIGEVYLFKSGRYYKIGKTSDTVRRGSELRIQLPEKIDLIHSIKTDDPSGVEAYWHRRFESKRMNGEWFDLNFGDIKAFKRWKHIV
jgi:hypothetical protein